MASTSSSSNTQPCTAYKNSLKLIWPAGRLPSVHMTSAHLVACKRTQLAFLKNRVTTLAPCVVWVRWTAGSERKEKLTPDDRGNESLKETLVPQTDTESLDHIDTTWRWGNLEIAACLDIKDSSSVRHNETKLMTAWSWTCASDSMLHVDSQNRLHCDVDTVFVDMPTRITKCIRNDASHMICDVGRLHSRKSSHSAW